LDDIPNYRLRFAVKPGLTGWAQIKGFRGETCEPEQMASRVHHDLHYIHSHSLFLDIVIMLRTFGVIMHPMAY
jgi:putative colanic acid biosynthesis UDP-glucose lipid carrier transferase